ncbi:hypothetical protein [Haloarchaeobius sp. DT45]|uniref:hypothetical protein n=1 Tax=Haloarchaeobius sp. DT45 TaxID=3446116 RepID=UPI003F6D0E84
MSNERQRDEHHTSRRTFLRAASVVATAAVAAPALSGVVSAHFPEQLSVDVRPGTAHNHVNPRARGVVPVAVHYVEFEDDGGGTVVFDPTERDVRYRFGAPDAVGSGGGARPVGRPVVRDVNGDGHDDLLLFFRAGDAGFDHDDETAQLRWERDESGHHGLAGSDRVTVVGR